MLEEIKAQMVMNQQMIVDSSTGFQERVIFSIFLLQFFFVEHIIIL